MQAPSRRWSSTEGTFWKAATKAATVMVPRKGGVMEPYQGRGGSISSRSEMGKGQHKSLVH